MLRITQPPIEKITGGFDTMLRITQPPIKKITGGFDTMLSHHSTTD